MGALPNLQQQQLLPSLPLFPSLRAQEQRQEELNSELFGLDLRSCIRCQNRTDLDDGGVVAAAVPLAAAAEAAALPLQL